MNKVWGLGLSLLIIITLIGCEIKKPSSVADIAYDNNAKNNEIYVLENGVYVPFIVVTKNYNGNVLLLRKDELSITRRINENSSYYPNSEMDNYLNKEYISLLFEIESIIIDTEVVVIKDDSIGISGMETESIERKVFILSCTEIDIVSKYMAKEGEVLKFFKNLKNRELYCNGCWLRTPNTEYKSSSYVIGINGTISIGNSYDKNGVRPAICVPKTAKIELRNDIVNGRSVYAFKFTD